MELPICSGNATSCVVALVSLQFNWSSSEVAVAIVLGARGIVALVCSIVLSIAVSRPNATQTSYLPSSVHALRACHCLPPELFPVCLNAPDVHR